MIIDTYAFELGSRKFISERGDKDGYILQVIAMDMMSLNVIFPQHDIS